MDFDEELPRVFSVQHTLKTQYEGHGLTGCVAPCVKETRLVDDANERMYAGGLR